MDCSLSNIFSILGILSSIFSMGVALYIYNGWTNQKQKEVVANDAGIIMGEIESLRQSIRKAYDEGTVDESFIAHLEEKHNDIKFTLSMIGEVNKNFGYEYYTNSLSLLITTLKKNPNSISKKITLYDVFIYTIMISHELKKLRLYIWK